jgi:Spy/CpxP family protein refolding chaperone
MKNRLRALAVMIAVLLAGCVLGMTGLHFWETGFRAPVDASATRRAQEQNAKLARRLQLTAAQEAQLKAILDDSRRQINAGRTELETKLETIRARTNEKIAAILNEEQKKKFQQLLSEGDVHKLRSGRGQDH